MSTLMVPVEGLMEVFQGNTDVMPMNARTNLLRQRGAEGGIASVFLQSDGRDFGTAYFPWDPEWNAENKRAQVVTAALTGAYMVMRGPVVFDGLDDQTIVDLLKEVQ